VTAHVALLGTTPSGAMLLGAVLLAATLIAGCGAPPEREGAAGMHDDSTVVRAAAAPAPPVITLERMACFGSCPVYAVALWADGRVQWDGRAHVQTLGVQETRVAADDVAALLQRLQAPRAMDGDVVFEEGVPECGRHLPDGPRFALAVSTPDGARHSVRFDAGCLDAPRHYTTLADEVDIVAGTRAFIEGVTGETQ
jgi:hypothetical protein